VWIALRNNPGEKHLTRDVASCGQGDNLIGREMHGEKARLDFFTIRRYFSRLSLSLQ
jgi:hypothetical protein